MTVVISLAKMGHLWYYQLREDTKLDLIWRIFLTWLVSWGTEAIIWIQVFRSNFWDTFFEIVTFLGEEQFYLFYLPLVYWCIDKQLGVNLIYLSLLSTYLNTIIKDTSHIPRPSDSRIAVLREEPTPSFPSNHAQGATVNFGYPAIQSHKWWIGLVAAVLVLLVSFSRLYLGVHYPHDIVGGVAIGLILILVFGWPRAAMVRVRLEPFFQVVLAVLVPLGLLLAHPGKDTAMVTGALAGIGVGAILEKAFINFEAGGLWWKRLARLALGLALTAGLYSLLKAIFPPGLLFRTIRYGLVGVVAVSLAPWLFVRVALAERVGGR